MLSFFNRKEDMVGASVFYGHQLEFLLELQKNNKIIPSWEAIVTLDLAKRAEGTELEQQVTARQGLA